MLALKRKTLQDVTRKLPESRNSGSFKTVVNQMKLFQDWIRLNILLTLLMLQTTKQFSTISSLNGDKAQKQNNSSINGPNLITINLNKFKFGIHGDTKNKPHQALVKQCTIFLFFWFY